MSRILVTGGGGFIGAHLASELRKRGNIVRVADLTFNGHGLGQYCDEGLLLDLRDLGNCLTATEGMDLAYNPAANMGGIASITEIGAAAMPDTVLIHANTLGAARLDEVNVYLVER